MIVRPWSLARFTAVCTSFFDEGSLIIELSFGDATQMASHILQTSIKLFTDLSASSSSASARMSVSSSVASRPIGSCAYEAAACSRRSSSDVFRVARRLRDRIF